MVYSNIESKMTPSMISGGGSLSDQVWLCDKVMNQWID